MTIYEEARIKITSTQLNKLKSAAKTRTGAALAISKKKVQDEKLLNELFLGTRQKTKIRNVFANNMSTDTRLSKTQLSKLIQSGGFLVER